MFNFKNTVQLNAESTDKGSYPAQMICFIDADEGNGEIPLDEALANGNSWDDIHFDQYLAALLF